MFGVETAGFGSAALAGPAARAAQTAAPKHDRPVRHEDMRRSPLTTQVSTPAPSLFFSASSLPGPSDAHSCLGRIIGKPPPMALPGKSADTAVRHGCL